jgi:hypothetical protein
MLGHIPSLETLESTDDDRLTVELRLTRLRSQLAVVRTLVDEVDQLVRPGAADGLGQLIEETARLGCRLLEAAASLASAQPREHSGVFARCASPPSAG